MAVEHRVDTRSGHQPAVVLVVSDHADSLATYAFGLLAFGFQPAIAGSVDDAFERACRVRPEAIVLDVTPPGESVVQFLRRVRDDARTAGAACLALSGEIFTASDTQLADAGCDRVVRTPCSPQALAWQLHDVLDSLHRVRG